MKQLFKLIRNRIFQPLFDRLFLSNTSIRNSEAVAQKQLMSLWRLAASSSPASLPNFHDAGFRKYSEFEEDGILLLIFSLIKPTNRICVEIAAGNGRECNTANLIINHGWWGHLFEGDDGKVRSGKSFYENLKDTRLYPPRFTNAWVTAENVNDLIAASGAAGPIDLLSLDIDGMDFWVWKAIDVIQPQVVVCETHNPIPPDKALTVPYMAQFEAKSSDYRGASLAAMTKLGRAKGYRLVGCHKYGFNAFFVKNGVGESWFPEVEIASCVEDPFSQESRSSRWQQVAHHRWQEV